VIGIGVGDGGRDRGHVPPKIWEKYFLGYYYVKFAFKLYCDLETRVWGHSRSSKMAPFDRAHTTLYSSSIVTMPLSLTVSEI